MTNVSQQITVGGFDLNQRACTACLGLLIFAASVQLDGAEIKGHVSQTSESMVRIVTDSDLVPNVGDGVEIYFEIPGVDEGVEVGTGKVIAVSADFIEVKIEQAKAKVTTNHLARIISSRPRKRSELAPAPHRTPTVPSGDVPKTSVPAAVQNSVVLLGQDSPIQALTFHPLGYVGASAGNRAIFWEMMGKELSRFVIDTDVINCQFFSPNGRFIACGTTEGDVVLRDTLSGKDVLRLPSDAAVKSVVFLSDKRHLLTGLGDGFTRFEDLDKPPKVSRDKFLVRLWDAQTKREIWRLVGHKSPITAVAASADGRRAASGCEGGWVLVWDLTTGKKLHQFRETKGWAIRSLCFSPDGKSLLFAGGEEGQWEEEEMERELARIGQRRAAPAESPKIDEVDDEALDERILRLHNLETGQEIRKFRGHLSPVGGATFFPDGRRILSGGWDKTLRIWDVSNGRELMRLEGHVHPICCVALSPDGTLALSGDQFGDVRLWQLTK